MPGFLGVAFGASLFFDFGFGVHPKAPNRVLGLLGEGFGFGGKGLGPHQWSRSLRAELRAPKSCRDEGFGVLWFLGFVVFSFQGFWNLWFRG